MVGVDSRKRQSVCYLIVCVHTIRLRFSVLEKVDENQEMDAGLKDSLSSSFSFLVFPLFLSRRT